MHVNAGEREIISRVLSEIGRKGGLRKGPTKYRGERQSKIMSLTAGIKRSENAIKRRERQIAAWKEAVRSNPRDKNSARKLRYAERDQEKSRRNIENARKVLQDLGYSPVGNDGERKNEDLEATEANSVIVEVRLSGEVGKRVALARRVIGFNESEIFGALAERYLDYLVEEVVQDRERAKEQFFAGRGKKGS